ncbi:uncharacterized protein LACBIDRAFT_318108 [Laccaria bicolor S238N-H82]|uniref:Predicted protein n=1 Tax=Laccaria bicolor (strain S238N-H82 / ATCC MYA-4686) TaxID=486041 RepID=B0D606_LACBS|nr:uncharacterized protein LACBIDRAFT_318108 [Laccaria bicolor S238N-H82]EDR09860.1 predicted protein [Laccaria bicolor S238N-H82]|eukprot:XP_001879245.1 predicted protein [Laccaria bicolor S238N-H82]
MDQLTDKPGWDKKVFDSTITTKWKEEALSQAQPASSDASIPPNVSEGAGKIDMTEKMVDWCIAELQFKAKAFQENGGLVSVYNGDVVKSDIAIPPELQASLRAAVAPLEDIPDRLKDWHPGSDDVVLDLVHPSLFPLVYGRSKILKEGVTTLDDCIERCGEGEVIPSMTGGVAPERLRISRRTVDLKLFSDKFQWLPCEVDISANDGNSVRIKSFINNLHPKRYHGLYSVIEQVIARAIPLWNMTLSPLKLGVEDYRRIDYDCVEYDPDPDDLPGDAGPQQEEGEDDEDYNDRRCEWEREYRRVVLPEPGTFEPPSYIPEDPRDLVDLREDYEGKPLQIIVKLANIHLTPQKPEYKGGKWHVEGQMNEHICATAIYYYDCENITNSRLAFRQQSDKDDAEGINYPQSQSDWLEDVFGCAEGDSTVQVVGSVETRAGRLITFPNILQHQVQPFSLEDRSKPGHRKILALFLVDPTVKVISTAHVPCQRKDWWQEVVNTRSAIGDLPRELQDQVFQQVDEFPFGMQEAKELRLELMEERKQFVVHAENVFKNQQTFSLCEH